MAAQPDTLQDAHALIARARSGFVGGTGTLAEADRALQAAEGEGNAGAVADARLLLGEWCHSLSQHGDAIEHFEAALIAAIDANDRRRAAEARRLMGFTHDTVGNFDLALEHHLAALRIFEEMGDQKGRSQTLRTIGVSASKSHDYEQAVTWYRQSLEVARRSGDAESIARSLMNLGIDLKNTGRLDEALAAQEESLALVRAAGLRRMECSALGNFGNTLARLGRDREAEQAYAGAIVMARQMGFPHAIMNAVIGMGKLCLRSNRLDEAKTYLEEGLEVAKRGMFKPDIGEAHEALTELYKKHGDERRALEQFELYHAVTREILLDDSKRRIKGLELRMRVDQAQRESQEHQQKSRELSEAYDRLQAATAEKSELLERLERQSREDALTGLANRRHVEIELWRLFAEAKHSGNLLAVAMIEVDRFRRISETFTDAESDAMVKEFARLLKAEARGEGEVARFGVDTFAVILPGASLERARQACERMRTAIEGNDWAAVHPWIKPTMSAGVAETASHANAEGLVADANARLRIARAAGGNRVVSVSLGGDRPAGTAESAADRGGSAEMIMGEQVRASFANLPLGSIAGFVVAALLCMVVRDVIPLRIWGTWLAAMALLSVGLWMLDRRYRLRRPTGAEARRWGRYATGAALAAGCLWGLGTVLLHTPDSIDYQLLVAVTAAIVGSSVAFASATYLPPFYAFFYPAVIPTAVVFLGKGDTTRTVAGLLLVFYLPLVTRFAITLNAAFVESLRLRFQNISLVGELREKKETAESANVAKSRFLAAASHDLRQPMHALGLFLQALRQGRLPDRERQLVDNIGESFNAMEGLFEALLDISRLDAGVVEPRIRTFSVKRILDRMRNEYAGQAAGKELGLAVIGCRVLVRSDPTLLEEIVGNFASNAVRHTRSGRIVIGCRRAGAMLRIEVWDTGPGIPLDKQREVFRDFVQLANPGRDRREGLGLGLAIVERLSNLLAHPVELRSQPGRGSMFRVSVPIGRVEDVRATESKDDATSIEPFEGKLIVVVDDDPAVLQAMSTLLGQWGCEVVSADSAAMILGKLATVERRPDLLLCDYRLRNGESGIEVIEDIRGEFNEDIPAVLITGDTAPDRLKEARESGLTLLHKPVKPAGLRSVMAQLLRKYEGAGAT